MKHTGTLTLALSLLLAGLAAQTNAATFRLQFTVTDFQSGLGPPPNDPVSGTIVWTAQDIHSAVQSFLAIDLTLDGHTYSTGEIGYQRQPPNWNVIGGLADGSPAGLWDHTDDFAIAWQYDTLTPLCFLYSSSQHDGMWGVYTSDHPNAFTLFNLVEVPEPSSTFLALLAASALATFLRKPTRQLGFLSPRV